MAAHRTAGVAARQIAATLRFRLHEHDAGDRRNEQDADGAPSANANETRRQRDKRSRTLLAATLRRRWHEKLCVRVRVRAGASVRSRCSVAPVRVSSLPLARRLFRRSPFRRSGCGGCRRGDDEKRGTRAFAAFRLNGKSVGAVHSYPAAVVDM